MKRFLPVPFLLGAFLLFSPNVLAAQIQNIDVTPTGNQILIEWDKLTDSEMFDENGGYVIQYSTVQNDIRNDKLYKNQVKSNQNTLALRAAGFERDETYYFRIYSLHTEGRTKELNNGSKILKWMWASNGDVTSEFIASNDPIIANNSSESIEFNFGKLRVEEFDTSAHFKWSAPSLGASNYDGFLIVLSKNDDLSSPLAEVAIPKTIKTSFIEELSPQTKYYAAGYFKKGSTRFAKSETISFTTVAAFTKRQKSIYERRILKRNNLGIRYSLTNRSASLSTSSSTTSTPSTTSTATSSRNISARITELKALIKKYQAELRSLEKQGETTAQVSSRQTTHSSSSSKKSSSRLQSIRDFLKNRKTR